MYEARKKSIGNTGKRNADGTFGSNQLDQNDPIGDKPHSTADIIAAETGEAIAFLAVRRGGKRVLRASVLKNPTA